MQEENSSVAIDEIYYINRNKKLTMEKQDVRYQVGLRVSHILYAVLKNHLQSARIKALSSSAGPSLNYMFSIMHDNFYVSACINLRSFLQLYDYSYHS